MSSQKRTALVTGANRGIGLEVTRQLASRGLRVFLGTRSPASVTVVPAGDVVVVPLDVTSDDSVASLARALADGAPGISPGGEHVDVLVNNAGVVNRAGVLSSSLAEWRRVMDTNFFGALRMIHAFVPAMVARGYGRVVNVSSGYGSFGEGLEGPAPYSTSKAALDALTLKLAQDVSPAAIDKDVVSALKVNACCPGWVRTDMGGEGADRSIEEGADVVVWLATLAEDGPSGGFFRSRKRIPW